MTIALPTGLSLAAINQPPTPDQWNDAEIGVANTLGLPTTSWQAGQPERTIFAVVANVMAQADVGASIAIQGGYLDFAASGTVTYVDATGTAQTIYVTPDPSIPAQNPTGQLGWLDVLADSVYNVQRILVAPASGTEALVNTSVSTYGPFAAGGYHVAQPGLPSKPTYSNKASLTIPPSTIVGGSIVSIGNSSGVILVTTASAHGLSTGAVVFILGADPTTSANGAWIVTVASGSSFSLTSSTYAASSGALGTVYSPTVDAFAADVGGTGSTAVTNNLVTTPVTSLIGVSVGNVGQWLGSDTESNLALANRCRLKLGSISNGGPSAAYVFFALSAQSYTPLLNPPLTGRPSAPITRAISALDITTGTVTTTIANSAGPPSGASYPQPGTPPPDDGGDVYAVGAVIQAYAVPLGTRSIVQAATGISITVAITAYVPVASIAAATSVIQLAVPLYFAALPVGGVVDPGGPSNVFPLQGLLAAVGDALYANNIRLQDMSGTLNGVAANVSMAATQVATFANAGTFAPTVTGV